MPDPEMPEAVRPEVTVIIPALNEEATIGQVIDRVLALDISKQVIVINDGSDDGTASILASYGDKILVLTNPARSGKGSAIRQALPHALGKSTIIQDADLEYLPEQIPMLVAPILTGDSKVVYGSRFKDGLPAGMALPNKIVNVLLALSVRLLFGGKISDEATCYKALDTGFLNGLRLECQRFEFCPEVTAKTLRSGQRIQEIPIEYFPRGKDAGKKIRWTDAPEAFWTLLRYRFWRP